MKKNKAMLRLANNAVADRVISLAPGKIMYVEDLPEEKLGNIILADEAQLEPHTGVVVSVADDVENIVPGCRIYFRPFSGLVFNLGPRSEGVGVATLHHTDIVAYERKRA